MSHTISRIHVIGASGSGTTTLAKNIASLLKYAHFDADDYYWEKTAIPYTKKRSVEERVLLLKADMARCSSPKWILSGSMCSWGEVFIPLYELVIFIYIPKDIRLQRIESREIAKFGEEAIRPCGNRHELYKAFVDWAANYDEGGSDTRSLALHEHWLGKLTCPVLKIMEPLSEREMLSKVTDFLSGVSN